MSDGTVAGRWPTSQLLSTLATIPDPLQPSSFLCGDDLSYRLFKVRICQVADIVSNSDFDNTGAPCDAVSVGFQFSAEPARLGTVYAVPPAPAGCMSDASLPFTDQCP